MRLLLLIIAISAVSCRCPQLILSGDAIHDTAYVAIHTRDTIYLPNEQAVQEIGLDYLCDSLRRNSIDSLISFYSKGHHVTSSVVIHNDKIVVVCKTDSLQAVIDSVVAIKQREEVRTNTVTVKSEWDKFTSYFFWIIVGLFGAGVTLKAAKII